MGTVISIQNFKGGVGKTTTAINLGAALAANGYKVLVIDTVGLCDATNILSNEDMDGKETIFDFFTGITSELFCYDTSIKNMAFVPSSKEMYRLDTMLRLRKCEYILNEFTTPMRKYFDYILIDCPSNGDIIIDNAIIASDYIIVPILCASLSLDSTYKLIHKVTKIKEQQNGEFNSWGLLATMYDERNRFANQIYEDLCKRFPNNTFDTRIHRSISLGEFSINAPSIFQYAPVSRGAVDYQLFANELTRKHR